MQWFLNAIGIGPMLPQGPLFGPWERAQRFPVRQPSCVSYSSHSSFPTLPDDVPLIPCIPFGVAYDLDLVVVSKHPTWNMHEIARVLTPEGPVWIAKDARETTLDQTITTNLPNVHSLFPELPVRRFSSAIDVEDRSTSTHLDLSFAYTNPDGEHTQIHYKGSAPTRPERLRNGSTMGHSRSQLLALLDLSHKSFARRASIAYDDTPKPLARLVGIVPFAMALQQVQGGLCTAAFTLSASSSGAFTTYHTNPSIPDAPPTPLLWTTSVHHNTLHVLQRTPNRTLSFLFTLVPNPSAPSTPFLELSSLSVVQWGRPIPTFSMTFSPALPDMRFPFSEQHTSRVVLDVNGQTNHAVGTVHATHTADQSPCVTLLPEAPWWTADRPMRTTMRPTSSHAVSIEIQRIDTTSS